MTRRDLRDTDDDLASYDDSLDDAHNRGRDGVSSLQDTESEQGDEEGLDDVYYLDDREAREAGVALDGRDEPEPRLD
jgi:hypothetical protein